MAVCGEDVSAISATAARSYALEARGWRNALSTGASARGWVRLSISCQQTASPPALPRWDVAPSPLAAHNARPTHVIPIRIEHNTCEAFVLGVVFRHDEREPRHWRHLHHDLSM
jgi:hypothetical protein